MIIQAKLQKILKTTPNGNFQLEIFIIYIFLNSFNRTIKPSIAKHY